ncbi:MAG: carbohydrate kinase [Devosia sp.]|nr:carbohydrate kinase [Devosia sp.]
MPNPRLVAVIDIGKTNAKVVLIDTATAQQVGMRSTPNSVVQEGPYPHADLDRLWAFLLQSLAELHAAHGCEGIAITTHGATAALLAGNDLALPVLDYEYAGPQELADEYGAMRPAFGETLSPRLPHGLNLGAQLFWQSRRFPEQFARVTHILAYPQYWAWRLTGALASEVTSLGCHTDLWAPARGEFSSLVKTQGWQRLFAPVLPASCVLGTLQSALSAQTGLPADTPVISGIHDSNASLLPHLDAHEAPFTILSTGTWTVAMTVGGNTAGLDEQRDSLANVDAFGRAVPTARFMGGREFDTLLGQWTEPSAADLAAVITGDIQALPSFAAGVGPFPAGKGRWTVDPAGLTGGQRSAATALYLALVTQACLELCGLGREIIIEGPFARNALFGAALARLTGVPVSASGDSTGTSLGASMLFGGARTAAQPSLPLPPLGLPGFDAYAAAWRERAAGAC